MNVIAFFAHPDDETMLAGGTLALLTQAGANVHCLCATRGEGGEVGEPPLCKPQKLGDVREREMVCAVQKLGARSLTFLGYEDPHIGPDEQLFPYTDDLTTLAGQVASSIRQFKADVVITHGSNGEYGHPAHILTFQAATIAVRSFNENAPLLYTVQATFPEHPKPRLANPDDPAHLVLDITPVLSRKEQAAMCHRTQHALFVRRSSQEAGRPMTVPEVIMKTESLHRVHPSVDGKLDDPLADLLRPWVTRAELK
jgi:LmbE family N-acetylglucosaminyl deacetylase